jgi:hypothetical protein
MLKAAAVKKTIEMMAASKWRESWRKLNGIWYQPAIAKKALREKAKRKVIGSLTQAWRKQLERRIGIS